MSTEDRVTYWNCYATGPEHVARPARGQTKGFYYFFQDSNGGQSAFDDLWTYIKAKTRSGQLGYYAGYSDDHQVIAVHYSDPSDDSLRSSIDQTLADLGVCEVRHSTKVEDNDLTGLTYNAEYDGPERDTVIEDFNEFSIVFIDGKPYTREDFLREFPQN